MEMDLMAKADTEICPYSGHVILDDDQEYCDWCGSEIKKMKPQTR